MPKIRLIVEIHAATPHAAQRLAGVISDYADNQFEAASMDGKPVQMLRSWTVKPSKEGVFK